MSNAHNTLTGNFNVYVQGVVPSDFPHHIGEFTTEAEARNLVASELRMEFDLKSLREATLDETDKAVADMDIDGIFVAVFIARAYGADTDDTIAIVRDVRA